MTQGTFRRWCELTRDLKVFAAQHGDELEEDGMLLDRVIDVSALLTHRMSLRLAAVVADSPKLWEDINTQKEESAV